MHSLFLPHSLGSSAHKKRKINKLQKNLLKNLGYTAQETTVKTNFKGPVQLAPLLWALETDRSVLSFTLFVPVKSIGQVSLKPPDVEAGISVNRDLQETPSVSGSETLQKISHFSYSFISVLMFQATNNSCQLTYSKIIANGSHSDRREMTLERTRNIRKEGRVTETSNV